jgi:hypothetical protein
VSVLVDIVVESAIIVFVESVAGVSLISVVDSVLVDSVDSSVDFEPHADNATTAAIAKNVATFFICFLFGVLDTP